MTIRRHSGIMSAHRARKFFHHVEEELTRHPEETSTPVVEESPDPEPGDVVSDSAPTTEASTEPPPETVEQVAPAAPVETVPEDLTKIDDLVEWVHGGDVATRAQAVLDQENTKPEKERRKTLIQQLTDLILEA